MFLKGLQIMHLKQGFESIDKSTIEWSQKKVQSQAKSKVKSNHTFKAFLRV